MVRRLNTPAVTITIPRYLILHGNDHLPFPASHIPGSVRKAPWLPIPQPIEIISIEPGQRGVIQAMILSDPPIARCLTPRPNLRM